MEKFGYYVNTIPTRYNELVHMINMGDNIQSIAVYKLLRESGVHEDDILEIPYYETGAINEAVSIIMQGHFGEIYDMGFINNPLIKPIFIGYGIKSSFISEDDVRYYKNNEPILCRDEFTRNSLRNYNIEAYISGCLTLTLEERWKGGMGRYYFVDVSERDLERIPKSVLEKSLITSQNKQIKTCNGDAFSNGMVACNNLLKDYCANAKMVITSKLHCMAPCVAMGVPAIAIGDNFSYRYTFIDAFVEKFSGNEIEKIDWANTENYLPGKKELKNVKGLLKEVFFSMVNRSPNMDKIKLIDDYFMKRKKWNYLHLIKKTLVDIFKGTNKRYVLWGASSGGYCINEAIKEVCPNSILISVLDSNSKGVFSGVNVEPPDSFFSKRYTDEIIIISTLSGKEDAFRKMQLMGLKENKDYFFLHENM